MGTDLQVRLMWVLWGLTSVTSLEVLHLRAAAFQVRKLHVFFQDIPFAAIKMCLFESCKFAYLRLCCSLRVRANVIPSFYYGALASSSLCSCKWSAGFRAMSTIFAQLSMHPEVARPAPAPRTRQLLDLPLGL